MRIRTLKGKRVGITILAIGLAALLLVTACVPRPIEEEETVVEIGYVMHLTGAAASSTQIQMQGILDYFRYFNEKESIPGVSIELLWADGMYRLELFLSHYERFVERGMPLIMTDDPTALMGLTRRFEEDNVIAFMSGAGYEEVIYPSGDWRYTCSPSLAEQFSAVAEYFIENWQEASPPRLVMMCMPVPFGENPKEEGGKYAQSLGFELLPPETVGYIVLDATTQLLRLKESGADLVFIQALPAASGPILRDAERLGLLDKMHFAGHPSSMGARVIEMTGVVSEGYVVARYYPWFDETEIPGIKLMLDNQMKYHGKEMRDAEYFTGWVPAAIICEAIRRAVENVGYENVDGAAIKESLDGMKDFDVYGLATVTYKPDDHRGVTKLAVYEVRDGKIVRVTDWREAPMLLPE